MSILGVTILVLSILTAQRTTINNRQNYAPQKSSTISEFYVLISLCIGGSICSVFIALYGINAVYHESKILVGIHAVLLFSIHSGALLAGSALFFDETQIGGPASLFLQVNSFLVGCIESFIVSSRLITSTLYQFIHHSRFTMPRPLPSICTSTAPNHSTTISRSIRS